MQYSILMTVYDKESPEFFEKAILSMLNQTVPSDDFVLVCDGILTEKLDRVLEKYADRLHIIRSDVKVGLSNALNIGLKQCKHEYVARMDSDDISFPDRCEKELKLFAENPKLTIVGGIVHEFIGEPAGEGLKMKRVVPEMHEDIVRFSYKRNPFNHPTVMYKKSAVLAIGGYHTDYRYFEDYDLWVRLFQNGAIGQNIPEVVLYMRISYSFYMRRGGSSLAKDMLRFHRYLTHIGWSRRRVLVTGALPRVMVCMMPNTMRRYTYKFLRKN